MTWQLSLGQRVSGTGGPIIIYWHGTGTNAAEVNTGFGAAAIQEVINLGGVVASPEASPATGATTGNNVWYRGDFDYADQIVACAIQQLNIDTRHIHTLGYSAGGLQASAMAYDRLDYVAAIGSYSGGKLFPNAPQDPSFLPPAMMMHGPHGSDVFIIDFYETSHALEDEYKSRGFFALDCEDKDAHISFTTRLGQAPYVWQFFKAHPYKVQPYPWLGGPPAGFPSTCHVVAP
jgi:predicted esterase